MSEASLQPPCSDSMSNPKSGQHRRLAWRRRVCTVRSTVRFLEDFWFCLVSAGSKIQGAAAREESWLKIFTTGFRCFGHRRWPVAEGKITEVISERWGRDRKRARLAVAYEFSIRQRWTLHRRKLLDACVLPAEASILRAEKTPQACARAGTISS